MRDKSLNFDALERVWFAISPPLYYATMDNHKLGEVSYIQEGEFHPEYIVCHPKDLAEIKGGITGRTLIPLQNYTSHAKESR